MKKNSKKIFISSIILFILTTNIFSLGAGVQLGAIPNKDGINGNITGTIKLMRIPAVFGFGLESGVENDIFDFGASGFFDYWLLDLQLHNTINLYAGPGVGIHILSDKDFNFTGIAGLRGIIGINWLLYDHYLELYAQGGVEPGMLIPFSSNPELSFNLNFPCEIGLRVHF